jgi:hypothetical protein
MKKAEKIAAHDFPVWREKADFIIAIRLGEELGIDDLIEWEQLWARKIDSDHFELCCVPFFAYGLALGDVVETIPQGSRKYVVDRVLTRSRHRTYRVFFQTLARWNEIIDEITSRGCTVEVRWAQSNLIAVDSPSDDSCERLESYLTELENQNEITWENGTKE